MKHAALIAELDAALQSAASPPAAQSLQRFFTEPVAALGVSNDNVRTIAAGAMARHSSLSPPHWLAIADHFARWHAVHEHFILASSLAAKLAPKIDDAVDFLALMQTWLERDADNWAQSDDLCIKPLYLYLRRRPHLMSAIPGWGRSGSSWCRRASNVALVKFVGRNDACDLGQVLANCERLLSERDPYVQKGIGWILKVAAQYETRAVLAFLEQHLTHIERGTLRYAIEKLPQATRLRFIGRPGPA
jgi:3-methyladenine DNA glycosylase AlkD